MGVSPDLFQSIRKWLGGGAVTSEMERHHREVLRAAFRSSGFLMRSQSTVYRTRSGTRPGDSIADTLFALVFAEAIQELRLRLSHAGLLRDVNGGKPAFPVWADDSVLPMAFSTAAELSNALPLVASIVHCTLECRAMSLNYGAGKTEALLHLSGPNSATVRRRLLGRTRVVPFTGSRGDVHELRLCQRYAHLGTVITERGGPLHDFRAKLAKAKQATFPLAARVLRDTRIDWRARRHTMEAIGVSAALHNTGIWHSSTLAEARVWERGIADLYRLTLPADGHTGHPAFPCTHSVSGAAGMASPAMLLVKQRILHACRIAEQQRELLWCYLAEIDVLSADSWLQRLRADIAIVEAHTKPFSMPVPERLEGPGADALFVWLAEHCGQLRRRVREACAKQAAGLWSFALFQLRAREAGLHQSRPGHEGTHAWRCRECAFIGSSYNSLAAHLHAAHGYRCIARAYASGTHCRVCLLQCWNTHRLSRHLAHGTKSCLLHLMCEPAPEQANFFPADACSDRLPATRLFGPLRQWAPLDHGCLASVLCSEPPASAQLLFPHISRHVPELEALAAANAFEDFSVGVAPAQCVSECPTGRQLIQQFLSSAVAC